MAVYLLCFSRKLAHAKHYLGWCKDNDVSQRVAKHRSGQGARLVRAAINQGIEVRLAHVIPDADRNFERKLKNRKDVSRWCPVCARNRDPRKIPVYTYAQIHITTDLKDAA